MPKNKKYLQKLFTKKDKITSLKIITFIIFIIAITLTLSSKTLMQKHLRIYYAHFVTNNSTMTWINYVEAWFDATSSKSFLNHEAKDGHKISFWQNSKTRYNNNNIKLIQKNENQKPTYIKNGIGNLPSIKFDGIDDYLLSENFQNNILQFKSASLFAVIENNPTIPTNTQTIFYHEAECNKNFELSLNTNYDNKNYFLGNFDSGIKCHKNPPSNYRLNFEPHNLNKSRNIIGILIQHEEFSNYHEYYITLSINSNVIDKYSFQINNNDMTLKEVLKNQNIFYHYILGGKKNLGSEKIFANFNGLIGEIIIFNRLLSQEDQYLLEKYLSRKWQIKIHKK